MNRLLPLLAIVLPTLACNISTPIATDGPAVPTASILTLPAQNTQGAMPTVSETWSPVQSPEPGTVSVWVFFTMAADENMTPVPATRSVPQTDNEAVLVRSTLKELLKGPTDAEKAAGLTSWFSPATADAVAGVIGVGGEYTVDFTGLNTLIPNASTSAGSQMLMSQLNSTVFQFDFVQSVGYTLDGDCAAFWEWLQMGCHTVTRAEWEAG
ncbi:MAG: GerMN domain-containing protein [Anaerolineales bacterium]|nr:GerMN domain-containing protein [Anaerolineales bacterium]